LITNILDLQNKVILENTTAGWKLNKNSADNNKQDQMQNMIHNLAGDQSMLGIGHEGMFLKQFLDC